MINQPCFAYNIWNTELCEIFTKLSFKYSTPAIIQISEKIAKTIDLNIFTKQVNILKENWPKHIFLNLDHSSNIKLVKKCVDLGWDMVMYDGSNLPLKRNISNTKEIANYAHRKNTLVEGEIDPIHIFNDKEKTVIQQKTDIKIAQNFIKSTGIDYFAISLGTVHGYSPDSLIKIDYDLLERASKELDVNLVLHGGSGLSISTYKKCFSMKVKKINISTEIKKGYKEALLDIIYKEDFDIRFLNQELFKKMEEIFKEKNQCFEVIK